MDPSSCADLPHGGARRMHGARRATRQHSPGGAGGRPAGDYRRASLRDVGRAVRPRQRGGRPASTTACRGRRRRRRRRRRVRRGGCVAAVPRLAAARRPPSPAGARRGRRAVRLPPTRGRRRFSRRMFVSTFKSVDVL